MIELGIALQAEVFRFNPKTKEIIEKVWSKVNDPFIANAIDALYGSFSNTSVNMKDTGGTTRSHTAAIYLGYNGFGDLGSTLRGIVVGSGSSGPAFDDYALGSLITHGTGAGQLFYYQGLTEYITSISDKRIRLFQRPIANKSGANVTLQEMGLILQGNSAYYYLFARDVIGGGLVLENGEYYLFQYAFEVSP